MAENDTPSGRRHRLPLGKLLLLALIGGVLAVALSESARSTLLDLMFGAEEEFDYTSTTEPSTPAPVQDGAAA